MAHQLGITIDVAYLPFRGSNQHPNPLPKGEGTKSREYCILTKDR